MLIYRLVRNNRFTDMFDLIDVAGNVVWTDNLQGCILFGNTEYEMNKSVQ